MKLLRRPRTPVAGHQSRAWTAGFLIAAAGVALAGFLPEHTASPAGPAVSWVLLAILFGIAEISVLHVQMRGGARTISLSEAPLVLGLFFTAPPQLVLARLVGPLVVFAIIRRQSLLKLGVNMSVLLVEVGMAVELFRSVLGGGSVESPRAWLAAYVAVLVAGVVSAVLVTLVIAVFQD
jgi:hypothetical protein